MDGNKQRKIPPRPDVGRVITFFDSMNLFNQAKRAFGYSWPNFDPIALSEKYIEISGADKNVLKEVRLYVGIPRYSKSRERHVFWKNKIRSHEKSDSRFIAFTRPLAYNDEEIEFTDDDGKERKLIKEVPREKGIDVRIALDMVDLAYHGEYDIAVLFSQDRDLTEAVKALYKIRAELEKWIIIENAFCYSADLPGGYKIGIMKDIPWFRITREIYDTCIDPNYYRPPPLPEPDKLFDE